MIYDQIYMDDKIVEATIELLPEYWINCQVTPYDVLMISSAYILYQVYPTREMHNIPICWDWVVYNHYKMTRCNMEYRSIYYYQYIAWE